LYIDSRNGPLSKEALEWGGLPPEAAKGVFEAPTYTCSHCQVVVVLNPKRSRERAYCRRCDHYICDACGALRGLGQPCVTYKQIVDEALEATAKQGVPSANSLILLR
jgi:hypothetical protein